MVAGAVKVELSLGLYLGLTPEVAAQPSKRSKPTHSDHGYCTGPLCLVSTPVLPCGVIWTLLCAASVAPVHRCCRWSQLHADTRAHSAMPGNGVRIQSAGCSAGRESAACKEGAEISAYPLRRLLCEALLQTLHLRLD